MCVLIEVCFVIWGFLDLWLIIECFSNGVLDFFWFLSCSIGGIGVFDSFFFFDLGLMLCSCMIFCMF